MPKTIANGGRACEILLALLLPAAVCAALPAAAACEYKYFGGTNMDLGTLGGTQSYAYGVSGDGSVVVGYSQLAGDVQGHAFRYANGAMTDIGTLGGIISYGFDASYDGSVIVGQSQLSSGFNYHAFKYAGGVMSDLGTLGGSNSYAGSISADGSVIVGNSQLAGDTVFHAYKYSGGVMSDIGTLGGTNSDAYSVSADGSTIVGISATNGGSNSHAFKYVGGTMSDLGTLGGTTSAASAVSADGSVIVGDSQVAGDAAFHAFKYADSVRSDLGTLGGTDSFAKAVSGDGSIIAGYSKTAGDITTHGFRYANGVMTDIGTLGGNYSEVHAISLDGSVLAGNSLTAGGPTHAFIYRTRMIDVTNTREAAALNGAALNSVIDLKTAMLRDSLAADCSLFGKDGLCLAAGGRRFEARDVYRTARSAVDVKAAYRLNPHLRAGLLLDQSFAGKEPADFDAGDGSPLLGFFAVLQSAGDGAGVSLRLSAAFDKTHLRITRGLLANTEAGRGSADLTSRAYQAELSNGARLGGSWTYKGLLGLRRTEVTRKGYTETSGADFPAAYAGLADKRTTAAAGLRLGGPLSGPLGLDLGAGLEHLIGGRLDRYSVSIPMIGAFALAAPAAARTRAYADAALSYKLTPAQAVTLAASLFSRSTGDRSPILSVSAAYTLGL